MTAASGSPLRMKSQWSSNSSGIFDAVMPMKPTLTPLRAHAIGPGGLVLVVDQRRQHERDVAVHFLAARPLHLVAGARQDGRDVGHVHARHVVELLLQIRHHRRHARERLEPRSVSADDRVLADETAIGFQVCENDPHQSPQKNWLEPLTTREEQRQAGSGGPRGDRGEKARLRGWRSRAPMTLERAERRDEAVVAVDPGRRRVVLNRRDVLAEVRARAAQHPGGDRPAARPARGSTAA